VKRQPMNARAEELLAERAQRPLDDKEHWELQQLGAADDESFDLAAAAVVVATTVIEPMPQALADQILAAAPGGTGGLDWRRTLPGVAMPLPADSPRDTMVSVNVSELQHELEKSTEPLLAQKPPTATKAMGVPSAALDTLPPPLRERPPAIAAPSLVHEPGLPRRAPDGRTPLPQDSHPFSVETPPMAVPISRADQPQPPMSQDELARRRHSAATVPLEKPRRMIAPWLAAAACLLVAGGAVWWAVQQRTEPTIAPVAATPASARAELMASASDVSKITWTVLQDPTATGATGDVVWSASQQKGYMRFVGLMPNDPAKFQYQLWIFDKTRDQAFPVDGGVFDVSSTGEVVVAISPKLHVNDLALFAVTVEKPGGVVVSKRERIVVTAART
jgi:hypothetical protein